MLLKIESYFKMSFEEIINVLHWEKDRSILWISNKSNVSRDAIYKLCKKRNLSTRNSKEAAAAKKTHNKHWAIGLTKENSNWALQNSKRMSANNPIKQKTISNKRAETISKTFTNKLWPQEKKFKQILESHSVDFEMQKPIGPYNIDFFVNPNLCIEIDSTEKWGKKRKVAAKKKDKFLSKNNFKVIRIDKRILKDLTSINNILYTNNVISKI